MNGDSLGLTNLRNQNISSIKSYDPNWRVHASQPVDYDVRIIRELLSPSNSSLAQACGVSDTNQNIRCLVAIDSNVQAFYGERLRTYFEAWRIDTHWVQVSGDEAGKTLEAAMRMTEEMTSMGILRRTEKIIAIGGGVVLDVVGLAASIYRRGTPYVRVPTTLMGQIDAGIGIKTGINFSLYKNRIGTYFAPETVLIDPEFLRTLPHRHVVNGVAEIIKMALIKDAALFDLLEANIADINADNLAEVDSPLEEVLFRSIDGMLDELEPNLWEQGLDRAVDYGHTFSPSLELRADPPLLHGEAVAIDMAICVALAHNRGLLSKVDADRTLRLMQNAGLPITNPMFVASLLEEALDSTVKHRDGLQRVPLTNGIGRAVFANDLTLTELTNALAFISEHQYAYAPETVS
jgi:2-epi-5-epi-valiolone synthase